MTGMARAVSAHRKAGYKNCISGVKIREIKKAGLHPGLPTNPFQDRKLFYNSGIANQLTLSIIRSDNVHS